MSSVRSKFRKMIKSQFSSVPFYKTCVLGLIVHIAVDNLFIDIIVIFLTCTRITITSISRIACARKGADSISTCGVSVTVVAVCSTLVDVCETNHNCAVTINNAHSIVANTI